MNHPTQEKFKDIIIGRCTMEEFTAHVDHLADCEACRERHFEMLRSLFEGVEKVQSRASKIKEALAGLIHRSIISVISSDDDPIQAVDKMVEAMKAAGPDGITTFSLAGLGWGDGKDCYEHLAGCAGCAEFFAATLNEARKRFHEAPEDPILKRLIELMHEVVDKVVDIREKRAEQKKSAPAESEKPAEAAEPAEPAIS